MRIVFIANFCTFHGVFTLENNKSDQSINRVMPVPLKKQTRPRPMRRMQYGAFGARPARKNKCVCIQPSTRETFLIAAVLTGFALNYATFSIKRPAIFSPFFCLIEFRCINISFFFSSRPCYFTFSTDYSLTFILN